jgi:glutamyl-tRNA reductase
MTINASFKINFKLIMSLIESYKVITVTHHNLDVQEIGSFYIQNEDKNTVIADLKLKYNIDEFLYLETCNRVSYVLYTGLEIDQDFLDSFFYDINPQLKDVSGSVQKFVSVYEGESAVKHVFEMASSMDSMVVGEREIFSQFRSAYDQSRSSGFTGDFLRLLENSAVVTAKQIYSETKIGERALSIVSLAIRTMLEKIDGNGQKVLLIGSGETNQLVGKFLKKYKFSNIEIYNRTIDNAKTLAETLGASSLHLSQLSEARDFDIIIICTSANRVVIDLPLYQKMLSGDQSKKIIIDLAVPRNVGEDVVNYSNVDYIDIQNLKALAEENLAFRKAELSKARPIVQLQLQAFRKKLHLRQFEKAISKLPVELTHVKDRAINVVYKKRINELPAEAQELVVEMMDYMEKKCVASTIKLSREL